MGISIEVSLMTYIVVHTFLISNSLKKKGVNYHYFCRDDIFGNHQMLHYFFPLKIGKIKIY